MLQASIHIVDPMPADDSTLRIQAAWQRLARLGTLPAVDERIRGAAGISLSRSDRAVLVHLREHGSLRVSELAHLIALDVSTMSRALRRLADAGYIDRRAGADLRAVRVSLTPAGGEALAKLLRAGQELIDEVLAGWPAAERVQLAEFMSRFAETFGDYLAARPSESHREEVVS